MLNKYKRANELLGTKYKSDEELEWWYISRDQKLPESFIREFKDEVIWYNISICQVLSEEFIREFKDKVDWIYISAFQILSWKFVLEFENKVDWDTISLYQPYIDSDYEKVNKGLLVQNKNFKLYQQTKNTNRFIGEKGWFIGYIDEKNDLLVYEPDKEVRKYLKVRIYWKDLKLINKIDKFEPIRRVKYV